MTRFFKIKTVNERRPDTGSDMPSSEFISCSSTRAPLSTSGTTLASSHLPTPRNSSLPISLPIADAEARRQVMKGVNAGASAMPSPSSTPVFYSLSSNPHHI